MRVAFACSLLALAACGSRSTASTPGPSAAQVAPAPRPTPPAPAVDPCAVALAHAAPVLDPVAASIEQRGSAHAETVAARAAWHELDATLRGCTSAGQGAWTFLPAAARIEWVRAPNDDTGQDEDSFAIHATAHLALVDARGGIHLAAAAVELVEAPAEHESRRAELLRVFDYDGDGVAEVFVRGSSQGYEDASHLVTLSSFAHGAVGAYAPAANVDIANVIDADDDGRPDIVSIMRFWSATDCGDDPPPHGSPPVLFHSVAGGAFSASDEAAKFYLRQQCGTRPVQLLEPGTDCNGLQARLQIACARAWGATADDVRAQLRRERGTLDADARGYIDEVWDELETYAAIDPPVVLH